MIRLSTDMYLLKSDCDPNNLLQLVQKNTLNHSLVMTSTKRYFIGRIGNNSFKIISSSMLPYGALCVVIGEIKPNGTIEIQTSLHKAFRVLYIIWLLVMVTVFILSEDFQDMNFSDMTGISSLLILGAFLFRLYMHGMYVWARNHSIMRLSTLLQSTWGKV